MKFLVDENCDALVVRELRELGHDVGYIAEVSHGAEDVDVLKLSVEEERILITEDLDFCELVFRDVMPAYAIILIRIMTGQRSTKARRVIEVIEEYGQSLKGTMISLSVDNVRVRPLP